jgi:hypothetical protein
MSPEDQTKADEIRAAPDVGIVQMHEPISEPAALPGTTRVIEEEYHSPTVHPDQRYRRRYHYANGPDHRAWAALLSVSEFLEDYP